jgi:hypothetical protein
LDGFAGFRNGVVRFFEYLTISHVSRIV